MKHPDCYSKRMKLLNKCQRCDFILTCSTLTLEKVLDIIKKAKKHLSLLRTSTTWQENHKEILEGEFK